MVKKLITEISEEDFRKLNLIIKRHEREENDDRTHSFVMKEIPINDILDRQIYATIENGYESDLADLKTPLTVAIHEPDGFYLDKFMNRFTGAQTYQLGWGIPHLYSTRDYYEAHGDYWRVRKDETKVIYRITLSPEWAEKFVLKHRSEHKDWCYNELPEGVSPDFLKAELVINYDLENGSWVETGRYGLFKYAFSEHHVPVDKDGNKLKMKGI